MLDSLPLTRWELYEIWVQNGTQWEMLASFSEFDVASAVARNRSSRMRLVHSVYSDGERIKQETLAELGTTRTEEELEPLPEPQSTTKKPISLW